MPADDKHLILTQSGKLLHDKYAPLLWHGQAFLHVCMTMRNTEQGGACQ